MDEVMDWDSEYATSMHTMGMWGCCVPTSEGLDQPAAITSLRTDCATGGGGGGGMRRLPSDQSPLLAGVGSRYTLGPEFS